MNIGVIGTGRMATALGKHWLDKGHTVVFGSRDPQKKIESLPAAKIGTILEAAQSAEVVAFTVPGKVVVAETIPQAGPLDGKVVMDCTNPIEWSPEGARLSTGGATSVAEEIARLVVNAKLVKAFNTNFSTLIQASGKVGDATADSFYCGDDEPAKTTVVSLIRDSGFNAVDIGPLKMARYLEALAVIMIQLRRMPGGGPDMGYKLLRA